MKTDGYQARWRSVEAEQRARQLEDALWSDAPLAPEPVEVLTSFGPTRAYHWPGSGPPLVFLHGIGGTSVVWSRYAAALEHRDVYAIDIMGDAGRSDQQVSYASAADMATWLNETLAGLSINGVHLVGHSLGGFVALNCAIHHPERLASLVVLDPVGIAELNKAKFFMWGLTILFASLTPAPVRRSLARKLRMPLLENKKAMRMGIHGQLKHPPKFPPLETFTDEQLARIEIPVTLLVGEKTEMFDAAKLVDRATRHMRAINAELVADAGHALTLSHLDYCAKRIDDSTRLQTPEAT